MEARFLVHSWCEVAGYTDLGKVRPENQDAFLMEVLREDLLLIAVADGMGGHRGGSTASRMAIEGLQQAKDRLAGEGATFALEEVVRGINASIFLAAQEDPSLFGMGTTLTVALVSPQRAWVAHVGDSRLYRLRGDLIERQTEDDSLVASLVREGYLSHQEAQEHPWRHYLTKAIGTQPEVEPQILEVALEPGDMLLLCSDGLTLHLHEEEILDLVLEERDLQRVGARMVERANERGGSDNITVVLLRLKEGETL